MDAPKKPVAVEIKTSGFTDQEIIDYLYDHLRRVEFERGGQFFDTIGGHGIITVTRNPDISKDEYNERLLAYVQEQREANDE